MKDRIRFFLFLFPNVLVIDQRHFRGEMLLVVYFLQFSNNVYYFYLSNKTPNCTFAAKGFEKLLDRRLEASRLIPRFNRQAPRG